MNMKKLIATALAVVMIFGLVSVGFAATADLPDVEGYEFEAEVRRLASLGVIAGYPDGTFRPEEPVKRAEFAKMIVVMLGLENAANLMKGQAVSFSDVSANHWASGYINVAEMKGVVNGYPDGTFKPEGNITYAEALKMILTAMGYLEDGFVVLRWPTTWIIQAAEIGLDEDVEVLANLPITRGEVAKLFDNSLTLPHVKVGEYGFEPAILREVTIPYVGEYKEYVTFMSKLGIDKVEGLVVDSPELWSNKTGLVEVKFDSDSETLEIEDYEGLLGHVVRVWVKGSKVVGVEDLSTEEIMTGEEFADEEIAIPSDVFVNYVAAKVYKTAQEVYYKSNLIDLEDADEVAVVKSGSKVVALKALMYKDGYVDSTVEYGKTRLDLYLSSGKVSLAGYSVEYGGLVKAFSEIKKNDYVKYIADSDYKKAVVIVERPTYSTYTGKLLGVTFDNKLEFADKVFPCATSALANSAKGSVGSKITVYIRDGKVYKIDAVPTTEVLYGVVQATTRKASDTGSVVVGKILTVDGAVEYELTLPSGYTYESIVNEVVYAEITGNEAKLRVLATPSPVTGSFKEVASATSSTITVNSAVYKHTSDTVWLDAKAYNATNDTITSWATRPVPAYKGDYVILYTDALYTGHADEVVVGVVKQYK